MQSIIAIPSDDIVAFLRANNISLSSDVRQNYLNAWELIKSNAYEFAPSSISDWIIASNLATSNIELPSLKLLDILSTPDTNLIDLTNQLTLSTIDKGRIIRILRYSNKLSE